MSRLDSFIRRMSAQRDCLNWAATVIADAPGPVLELGLGNGRTYDHIRDLMPERDIFVFDRQIAAHPACIPPEDHMFLGEINQTLPAAQARLGTNTCALIHTDVGSGDAAQNAALAALIAPYLADLAAPGGLILADQELPLSQTDFTRLAEPAGVPAGRYYIFQKNT